MRYMNIFIAMMQLILNLKIFLNFSPEDCVHSNVIHLLTKKLWTVINHMEAIIGT